MQHFAMIFRQGAHQLNAEALKARAAETRVWAQGVNAAGHQLDPHILESQSELVTEEGRGLPMIAAADVVTAILLYKAIDFTQACEVARAHPAIRYGAVIEVRPWTAPNTPS